MLNVFLTFENRCLKIVTLCQYNGLIDQTSATLDLAQNIMPSRRWDRGLEFVSTVGQYIQAVCGNCIIL